MSIGIIAGTGVDFLSPKERWSEVPTPYGPAHLATAQLGEVQVFLVRRHGPLRNVPPHLINYRANLWALKDKGVERILATAAVGSLREDLRPGALAVISDFIDFTKQRQSTLFDSPGEVVVHVDFTTPYCPSVSDALEEAARASGIVMDRRVTYLCVDGPRYETPVEVRMFAQWGAHVIGMTGVPEVTLARELGMCYGSLGIVTNYAAGILDEPLSHKEVLRWVAERREQVHNILTHAVEQLPRQGVRCSCAGNSAF